MSRPRSLQLLLDGIPDEVTVDGPSRVRITIFNSLVTAGVPRDEIEGIECLSKKLWFIVFHERAQRQKYIGHEIRLFEKTFILASTDPPRVPRVQYTFVKIFGYPLDTRAEILEQCMRVYGELLDIRDDVDNTIDIKTGVKTARYTKLNEDIPSFIYAGRYHVRTSYTGQPKTCRNCAKTGHVAKDCQAGKVCRICGEPGHNKGECPDRRCFYCKGRGHEQTNCDKYREDFPGIGGNNDGNGFGPPRAWGDPDWYQRMNEEHNTVENAVPENRESTERENGMEVTEDGMQDEETGTAENGSLVVNSGTQGEEIGGTGTTESGTGAADGDTQVAELDGSETGEQETGVADGGTRSEDSGGTAKTEPGKTITNSGESSTNNGKTENTTAEIGATAMETTDEGDKQSNGAEKERVTDGDSSDGGEAPIKRLKNNEEQSVKVPEQTTDKNEPTEKEAGSSDENENLENQGNKKSKRKGRSRGKRKPATVVSHANNRNPFLQ